ncbi:MAG: hypothetical protein JWN50_10 [Parcubacteria group bacterium]|nr:hypothetical protein [Parcubacteria group bacterium]
MKKILILLGLICAAIGVWHFTHSGSGNTTNTTVINSNPTTSGHPDASNATFTFEDGQVTLSKGTFTAPTDPDSGTAVETDLSNTFGYGDLNADGKEDVVVILVQSGAGSGTFFNIAAYVSGPISYKGTNAVFVGDRIVPKSISIKNKTITLTYLDRNPDEPMAADPTVLSTKTYLYSSLDNSLQEQ